MLGSAHVAAASAHPNASSVAISIATAASGDFGKAMTAALATLGGRHAPVVQARGVLYGWPESQLRDAISAGGIIPGFGHSFVKDSVAPEFTALHTHLKAHYLEHAQRLDQVASWIEELRGKRLYANAAGLTACVAELVGFPRGAELALFVGARLPAWVQTFVEAP